MSYSVDWNGSLHICTFTGTTNGIEIIECNDKLQGDSRFDNIRATIWDFSQVEDFDLTVEQCIRIAAQDKAAAKTNQRIKIAIVADQDIVKRIMYLYESEMLDAPFETQVFQSIGEAMRWCS